ncbi:MAG: peptidylprolyl isomerase [Anaerolineales bacterium]
MPPKNKKFIAQKQKEDLQKKIIIIATISVLVIVFGLIVYGVLDRYVFTPNTAIISLEGENIKGDDFEQQARWVRRSKIMEIDQILMTIQQLGGSNDIYAYFKDQLLADVNSLEQPLLTGQEVLQTLTQDIIYRVEAKKMGIEITDAEVDRAIEEAFGYYAEGTPTPIASKTPLATSTPQADDSSQPDPTATPLLQPTEYTEELYQDNYQSFLDDIKNDGITEDTIRQIVEISLIQEKLFEAVTADVSRDQEQVWIRHILVEDEETAKEVIQKLDDGEDFADLALEYSIDDSNKEQGGDLGWFPRGTMIEPFEEAAFALEVGQISDPVQTDYGWHILESLGKENRPLTDSGYSSLQNQVWNDWVVEINAQYDPDIKENWVKFVPTEPALPQEYITFINSLSQQQLLPTDIPLPTTEPQPTPEPQE